MKARTMGWKAKYATGITSLDDEHKELIARVNTLISALESPDTGAGFRSRALDGYAKVRDHVITHFCDEEQVMHNIGFPGIEEHIAQHKDMLDELDQLGKLISEGLSPENWAPQANMLNVWVLRHIMSYDVKIRGYIHRRPAHEHAVSG